MNETRPMPPPAPAESEIDLRALWSVLLRRIWILIGIVVASVAIGALVTVRQPKIYRAVTTLLIEPHTPEVLSGVREVYDLGNAAVSSSSREFYQTQYNIIRSRPVAQKVVAMLGLSPQALSEEIRAAGPAPADQDANTNPLGGLPQALLNKLSLLGLDRASSREVVLKQLESLDIASFVQSKVRVDPVRESRLAQISIEDTIPERAALFANAVADAYIEVNLDQKLDFTRSAVDWLSEQMSDLKDRLEQSELALHEFKKANNIVSVSMEDMQTMNSQTLTQLNTQLSTTHAHRLTLESRREHIQRAIEAGQPLDTLNQVIGNTVVQNLKSTYAALKLEEADLALRYTSEHPKLIAVHERMALIAADIDAEIKKVINSLNEEYETVVDTEHRLKAAIEEVKAETLELNKKEIDYSRLKREKNNNQSLYELVLRRQKEADLTQMLKVNNVRRLESANVPRGPIRPNVQMNLLLSLAIGMIAGALMVFLVDYLDSSLKSQEQVERVLALPFLGIMPSIKGEKTENVSARDHYVISHPHSSFAECCRTVRTNLLFMSPEHPARALLVTSSGPREGKSTTVVNLAITMAQSGAKVLAIDTDMRRPRLHKSFNMPNERGMSNLILGENSFEEVIQNSGVEGLDLLPCGPIPPNPAELLHTQSFRNIVAELRKRYDLIIFDSPPVGAVTDASVLASMMDGLVLVVNAGNTTWQAAKQTKRRLEDVNGRILGVVLNNVDLDNKRSGYYYHYYYYRSRYSENSKKDLASVS